MAWLPMSLREQLASAEESLAAIQRRIHLAEDGDRKLMARNLKWAQERLKKLQELSHEILRREF